MFDPLLVAVGLLGLIGWSVLALLIYFVANIDTPADEVRRFAVADHFTTLFPIVFFSFYLFSALSRLSGKTLVALGVAVHLLAIVEAYQLIVMTKEGAEMHGASVPTFPHWAIGVPLTGLILATLWISVCFPRFKTKSHSTPDGGAAR